MMAKMEKHFVKFYSAGTFLPETTCRDIPSWDVGNAVEISKTITERYGAKPYGFSFITRSRTDEELDSKVTKTSPMYYLGGRIETAEEILARIDPEEEILRSNIECNGIKRVVISGRSTLPLKDDDIVLDV